MKTNDPNKKYGVSVPTINRRKVLKGVGAAGAIGVLGTGPAAARHKGRGPQEKCDCIDNEDTVAWGKYDFQCVDYECTEHDEEGECVEQECVEWGFVHTEGDDVIDDITVTEVKDDDPSEPITVEYEAADGYVVTYVCAFGGNDNDDDDDPDGTYESGLTTPNGRNTAAISNLTFCVELEGWQVDLIYGEPIVNFDEDSGRTYNDENRLLQALWADPDDEGGRLEDDSFDRYDDAYEGCDANIVQDITFDPETGMATAILDPGECDCEDFDLVSYDAPGYEWQGGEDQILYGSAQGHPDAPVAGTVDTDEDGNCVFTVPVPAGGD